MMKKKKQQGHILKIDKKNNSYTFSNRLSSHLERFVNYLQYTKNASPKTIENYSLRVNRFIDYV
jgi:hypothetical protein